MKKRDIITITLSILLIASAIFAIYQINKVYKIKFEWYSPIQNSFVQDKRTVNKSGKSINTLKESMGINIFSTREEFDALPEKLNYVKDIVSPEDIENNIFICAYLGKFKSPEYDMKILEISQRQNKVEVLLNISEPYPESEKNYENYGEYEYKDIIKISKNAFYLYKNIVFVFKNRDGVEVYRQKYFIQ